ncbi:hypothetical protein Dda_4125 [Drechslerella dactyloides]|uniref:NAD-dependent epimerase/dehydratase domain-containing protein n=1 Tax=Drechslerella dactyloides TaxID=74499 RepID=A0AAD6IZ85_DREDA|nr:hypothetical protein Dda_4125 [Drechslerella dactyloides]
MTVYGTRVKMVRVLLFGATGFIGNPLAAALRRRGHTVYAVVRSEAKAIELSKQELIPILGDASEPGTWTPVLDQVDIVIDGSPSYGGISKGILDNIKSSSRVASAKKSRPKLGFIYISGVWVYGDYGDHPELVADTTPVGPDGPRKPTGLVSWRPEFENSVLESRDVIDVLIVRPGMVFGGHGSLFGVFWKPLVEALKANKTSEPVTLVGRPNATMTLVHKDDAAEAILNAVEKFETVSQISSPIFNLSAGHEKLGDINKTAAKVLGITGEIIHQAPTDPFSIAMSTSLLVDTTRSQQYLDWHPRHTSLIRNAEIYVKAHLYTTDYYSTVNKA